MKVTLLPLIMTLIIAGADLAAFPWLIRWLQRKRFTQYIREEGPQSHKAKQGTPVGGGIILVCDLLAATAVYLLTVRPCHLSRVDLAAFIFVAVNIFSGFLDDMLKERRRANTGLLGYQKLLIQAAAAISFFLLAYPVVRPRLSLPGGRTVICGSAWLFYAVAVLYAMGMVNAFNLTDGLDGLLTKTGMPVFAVAAGASLVSPIGLAGVLPFAALAFCVSFLWYNGSKASLFMGDLGSLALGSVFVAWAFISGYEVSSLLLGGLFLIEAASVIIQVSVFKASGRKKRVFLMAPIHHHFEKLGWAEPKIVDRFFVVSVLFVLAGVLTMVWR